MGRSGGEGKKGVEEREGAKGRGTASHQTRASGGMVDRRPPIFSFALPAPRSPLSLSSPRLAKVSKTAPAPCPPRACCLSHARVTFMTFASGPRKAGGGRQGVHRLARYRPANPTGRARARDAAGLFLTLSPTSQLPPIPPTSATFSLQMKTIQVRVAYRGEESASKRAPSPARGGRAGSHQGVDSRKARAPSARISPTRPPGRARWSTAPIAGPDDRLDAVH